MARPVLLLECAFASKPDDFETAPAWVNITQYLDVQKGVRITRGRQDEFSEVQPSQLELTLDNRDGRFTPNRVSSPYYPNVTVGKLIRLGEGYPGNGKQLLSNPSFEGGSVLGWSGLGSGAPSVTASSVRAQHGTGSLLATWNAGTVVSAAVTVDGLVTGNTYCASAYVWVPAGSPPVRLQLGSFIGAASTTNGAWERISTYWTATQSATQLHVRPVGTPTPGNQVWVDSVQLENGLVPTAFEPTPGVFSWRFYGDVNEWPLGWSGSPALYAESNITAADRMARLGELGEFRTFLVEEILSADPIAYYPLGESRSSKTGGDISGNGQAPVVIRQVGSGGSLNFGSERTASDVATVPPFYADRATSVGFNAADNLNGKYLVATPKDPIAGAAGSTVVCWALESALPLTTGPLVAYTATNGSWFGVTKSAIGNITAEFFNASTGVRSTVASGIGLSSTETSIYAAVLDIPSAGNGRISFYANATLYGSVTFTMASVPTWREMSIGGRAKELFRGNISNAQFYNYPIAPYALTKQTFVGFYGQDAAGDSTSSRATRFAINFRTLPGISFRFQVSGTSQPMGPQEIEGSPQEAFSQIVKVEDTTFHIRGDGVGQLQFRDFRFNRNPDLTITADRLEAGAVVFRGDTLNLFNDVTASRPGGGMQKVVNQASVDMYGRRKTELDALVADDNQLTALAARRAYWSSTQQNRITGLRLSLLNFPSLITGILPLDISSKILITGLPTAQAPSGSVEVFIEGWTETISESDWTMELNASPATNWNVWQLGVAGRSELNTTTVMAY